jgi:hypothetical protein
VLERVSKEQFRVQCDGCFRASPVVYAGEDEIQKLFTNMGWARLRESWACPICQTRGHRRRLR